MIYCTKCGTLNEEDRNVCDGCGESLKDCPVVPKVESQRIAGMRADRRRRNAWIACGIWLLCFVGVATVFIVTAVIAQNADALPLIMLIVSLFTGLPWLFDRFGGDRFYEWVVTWSVWTKRLDDRFEGYEGCTGVNEIFKRRYRFFIIVCCAASYVCQTIALAGCLI